jgi:hypothetical protein
LAADTDPTKLVLLEVPVKNVEFTVELTVLLPNVTVFWNV